MKFRILIIVSTLSMFFADVAAAQSVEVGERIRVEKAFFCLSRRYAEIFMRVLTAADDYERVTILERSGVGQEVRESCFHYEDERGMVVWYSGVAVLDYHGAHLAPGYVNFPRDHRAIQVWFVTTRDIIKTK